MGSPLFANALQLAFDKATTEGKVTIMLLALVSLFSWTVIITKGRQIYRAHRSGKKFFAVYRATRESLDLFNKKEDFTGAPAFDVYMAGAEELEYQLETTGQGSGQTCRVRRTPPQRGHPEAGKSIGEDQLASFESIRVALERAVSAQSISLEKGMINPPRPSPEDLSSVARHCLGSDGNLLRDCQGAGGEPHGDGPRVAGALIATVVGLFVAIPAMFAYNYMITSVRSITQELDTFTAELATAIEHRYVDNRSVADEIDPGLPDCFPERAEELELARA